MIGREIQCDVVLGERARRSSFSRQHARWHRRAIEQCNATVTEIDLALASRDGMPSRCRYRPRRRALSFRVRRPYVTNGMRSLPSQPTRMSLTRVRTISMRVHPAAPDEVLVQRRLADRVVARLHRRDQRVAAAFELELHTAEQARGDRIDEAVAVAGRGQDHADKMTLAGLESTRAWIRAIPRARGLA